MATGATLQACLRDIRKEGAESILLAVPVAPPDSLERLRPEVDQVVCLYSPTLFSAVGQFYRSFDQTPDEEVIRLLEPKKVSQIENLIFPRSGSDRG